MPGHASKSTARPNIHGAKIMLYLWWDPLGVVHYELLKSSETITKGSLLKAIYAFEPRIEGKTSTVPRGTRQIYPPTWQRSATCHNTGQDILGNAEMGSLTLPTVLSRRCSFRLPFELIARISALIKKSKSGWIRESPQKTHRFFKMVSENCQKDGKR